MLGCRVCKLNKYFLQGQYHNIFLTETVSQYISYRDHITIYFPPILYYSIPSVINEKDTFINDEGVRCPFSIDIYSLV